MKKALYILGLIIVIITFVTFFSPSGVSREQVKKASGVVTAIYASGSHDAVFKISDSKMVFCIKRHLKKGVDLADLKSKVLGKKVTILYTEKWTPFDPSSKKQIAELISDEDLLYSELAK